MTPFHFHPQLSWVSCWGFWNSFSSHRSHKKDAFFCFSKLKKNLIKFSESVSISPKLIKPFVCVCARKSVVPVSFECFPSNSFGNFRSLKLFVRHKKNPKGMWVTEYRASRFSSLCVHIGTYLSKSICCVFCSMQTFMVHSFVFFYHRNKKWKRARCLFPKPPNETWKNRRHRKRPKAGKFREKSFARCTEVRQTKRMAHNHVKLKLEKYKLHCLWPCLRKSARSRCEFTFSECDTYNKVESGSFIDNCKLFGCWLLVATAQTSIYMDLLSRLLAYIGFLHKT